MHIPTAVAQALDAKSLETRLRRLARFGAAAGGVDRQALTPAELEARRWLVAPYAARSGYRVGMDAAANLFVERGGRDASLSPVLTGSHLDTQACGGWLDGAFGVVAGLCALDSFDALGVQTLRPITVVAWSNEEGCRFAPGTMGSQAFCEPTLHATLAAATDAVGIAWGEACRAAVADLQQAAQADGWALHEAALGRPLHAYLEAHIEQGPVLESLGTTLGCVTGIQGTRWFELVVEGRSAHAGTTPMGDRDDAMARALPLATALIEAARGAKDPDLRLTIGRISATPGAVNTIASRVAFTVDLRHPSLAALDAWQARIAALARGARARLTTLQAREPMQFDPRLILLAQRHAEALGISHLALPSGAFHDALHLARHAPSAMLFAPSRGGISHHGDEDTDPADLASCARVLAASLAELADQPSFQREPP